MKIKFFDEDNPDDVFFWVDNEDEPIPPIGIKVNIDCISPRYPKSIINCLGIVKDVYLFYSVEDRTSAHILLEIISGKESIIESFQKTLLIEKNQGQYTYFLADK
jgi:hypothetical protein